MKSYTDLEQSKMLAEILPIESADMWWNESKDYPELFKTYHEYYSISIPPIPTWSLASLLEILPDEIIDDNDDKIQIDIRKYDLKYLIAYRNDLNWSDTISTDEYDNLVDACVEMILKLHEEILL